MDAHWPLHFQPNVVRPGFGTMLSSYTLALEAWRRGLTVSFRDHLLNKFRIFEASGRSVGFIQSRPEMTSVAAHGTAKNKHKTNNLLRTAGLPVPESVLIDPRETSSAKLLRYAEQIGYPLVLKPRNGAMGQSVYANIQSSSSLTDTYAELIRRAPAEILVLESHVPGDDYRLLVFGDQYIAACQRVPANITGDGVSTVDKLIKEKNRHRRENPFLSKGLIRKDHEVLERLAQYGYSGQSVPTDGEYLRLRNAANASAGGDVIDVTEELPQRVRDTAVQAVAAIPGLHCAGVDILYNPATATECAQHAVLELNSQPQIGVNMYPTHGSGVDVPQQIIDICFPDSQRSSERAITRTGFRVKPIISPMASTHLSEVTLAPLPPSGYPARYLYRFAEPVTVPPPQRDKILRASRKHSVAGSIRYRNDQWELLAAGRKASVDKFVNSVAAITSTKLSRVRRWKGVIFGGFTIDA